MALRQSTAVAPRLAHLGAACAAAMLIGGSTTARAATTTFQEIPLRAGSGPSTIAVGPDGAVWFTEETGNRVGRATTSGTLTEFRVPTANATIGGIARGPDGNVWFLETKTLKIARLVPSTGQITEFATPVAANGIVTGSDGNLWVVGSTANRVLVVSTAGAVLRTLTVPTAGGFPHGPTLGPDGNVYFAETNGNKIGRVTPSGTFKEWRLPQTGSKPLVTAFGPDGRLYFTESTGNRIGRLDTTTGAVSEFTVPTPASSPQGITLGSDGNLWFTENAKNQLGRMTTSGTITEFPLPIANSGPKHITGGPDGNLWFTQATSNHIGIATPPSTTVSLPTNTSAPTISGSAVVGQTLTAAPGTWTGSPTFGYAWQQCDSTGANCGPTGATGQTYTVANGDVGSTLEVVVTGTNSAGSATATSQPTPVVISGGGGGSPTNTSPPTVTGNAVVGQTLTAAPGTWTGSPTFGYAWQECDSTGANCGPTGKTGQTYTLGNGDVGSTLEVVVTGTNTSGSATATSQPTAVVTSGGGGGIGSPPSTPVLDDFNRANGAAGANWATIKPTGFAALKVAANAVADASTTQFAWDYWTGSNFGPDCEAYVTVAAYGASDVVRIGARIAGAGTATFSGYFVSISATGVWTIIRVDNGGAPTTLATGPTQPLASGDKLAIQIVGSTIAALHFTTAGGWATVTTYDTAGDAIRYTAAGAVGLELKTSTLDDFGGGAI